MTSQAVQREDAVASGRGVETMLDSIEDGFARSII
jgi:hypothetical protein